MIETKDIYWLAGLFEGEGSFCLRRRVSGEGAYPTLQLGMTDRDVIEHAREALNYCGPISSEGVGTSARRTKPLYRLTISGPLAAGWMMTLYPLLGERRRGRIVEVLQAWRESPAHGKWKRRPGYKRGEQRSLVSAI